MADLAVTEFHNNEYIKDAESRRHHCEEITGNEELGMVARMKVYHRWARSGVDYCRDRGTSVRCWGDRFNSLPILSSPRRYSPPPWPDQLVEVFWEPRSSYRSGFLAQKRKTALRSEPTSVSGLTTTSASSNSIPQTPPRL
jgi:hypothetical protein